MRPVQPVSMTPGVAHAPRFGQVAPVAPRLMDRFDFEQVGTSTLPQTRLIYSGIIASRILAASQRSWNEVREATLLNAMGWVFWFFTTPVVLRGFLKALAPELLHRQPEPVQGTFAHTLWRFNPLKRYDVVNTSHLQARLHDGLKQLADAVNPRLDDYLEYRHQRMTGPKNLVSNLVRFATSSERTRDHAFLTEFLEKHPHAAITPEELDAFFSEPAVKTLTQKMERLTRIRNFGTGLGIAMSILIIGWGIPWINILMTRANVAQGKIGKYDVGQDDQPADSLKTTYMSPSQPTLPTGWPPPGGLSSQIPGVAPLGLATQNTGKNPGQTYAPASPHQHTDVAAGMGESAHPESPRTVLPVSTGSYPGQ